MGELHVACLAERAAESSRVPILGPDVATKTSEIELLIDLALAARRLAASRLVPKWDANGQNAGTCADCGMAALRGVIKHTPSCNAGQILGFCDAGNAVEIGRSSCRERV